MNMTDAPKMYSKKLLPTAIECAVCTKFGDLLCERCGETYCSKFCQTVDWREHRRICMPLPRLMQRSEVHVGGLATARMLMDANGGFDATDAIGSVSEHSALSETVQLSREQIVNITNNFDKMQIEGASKIQKLNLKTSLSEIEEVLSTPPITPKKTNQEIIANAAKPVGNVKVGVPIEAKRVDPPMVLSPPPKKQQSFKPSVKVIESQAQVIIVHVENHQTVFVVPITRQNEWKELIDRTNGHAGAAESLRKPPQAGYIILAKPKISDAFSRGLIQKIRTQDEIAKVEFMEYGFTDIVKFSDMKCLTEDLVNASRLVNKVTLKGVPDNVKNANEVQRYLTSLQENQTPLIIKHLELIEKTDVTAHFAASLIHGEKFIVINEILKDLDSVESPENVEIEEIPEPVQIPSKKEIQYTGFAGKNLELYILDTSFMAMGIFSAIQGKDMALLGKNDAFINDSADVIASLPIFHPRDAETCLAQSLDDKRWYRACSHSKIDDKTYNLIYIDYGNMEKVSCERIRGMQEEFFFPCITTLCCIDELNEASLTPEVVNRLNTIVEPYTKVTFDEVKYNGEEAVVKSEGIINILKNERLI